MTIVASLIKKCHCKIKIFKMDTLFLARDPPFAKWWANKYSSVNE